MGGLGNQLQQYALYRRLVAEGISAKIDLSWFNIDNQKNMLAPRKIELDKIRGVKYEVATQRECDELTGGEGLAGKIKRHFFTGLIKSEDENGRDYLDDVMDNIIKRRAVKDLYLSGYFAAEKYYFDILPLLRNEIKLFDEINNNSSEMTRITNDMKEYDAIAVHIRRGDYLAPENYKEFGNICTEKYYESAIAYVIEETSKPKLYFFSDDIEYVEKFNHDLVDKYSELETQIVDINKGENSYLDIYLMSQCKHNIAANSTFSFWGARLTANEDKIMIRPTIHRNTQEFDEKRMKDLWKGWILISPEGIMYK